MTLPKLVVDTADAALDNLKATLQAAQEAYFKAQVGMDEDGRPILRGKYQRTAPVTVGGMTYEMHEYDGPDGKGFILHAWVTSDGKLFHRQRDFGPEGRTQGWEQVGPL